MLAVEQTNTNANRVRVMWLALALAVCAALAYVMIAQNILGVGDLRTTEGPPDIVYLAAGSYLLGGLLILLRMRWLWIAGAVMNALVMFSFAMAYAVRPAVLFSPGGLATKTAQLLLEAALIYLIATDLRRSQSLA